MTVGPLRYYAEPGVHTRLDDPSIASSDVTEVVGTVQGLLVYDLFAELFYGAELPAAQADAIHERTTVGLLDIVRSCDPRPLGEARPPVERAGARCHAFARVTVALLRAGGVPARARCGFGAYFVPDRLEDHWVAEYWDATNERWTMVDAQLDGTWIEMIGFAGDSLAITADEFVTAGHAWQAWRAGELDAGRCGLTSIDEHGAHWIAGNLRLDLAALNKVEMLPWDVWGSGWEPGAEPTDEQLDLFDAVAALTVEPDRRFDELRRRYADDDRLRMDGTVFSVARGEFETVPVDPPSERSS